MVAHLLVGLLTSGNVAKVDGGLDWDKKTLGISFSNSVYGSEIDRAWSHRSLVLGDDLEMLGMGE